MIGEPARRESTFGHARYVGFHARCAVTLSAALWIIAVTRPHRVERYLLEATK
jgi:hypothetical protein